MYKLLILSIFLLIHQLTYAQIMQGNYIKTKITYRDGAELEDQNALKYSYLRYSFDKPGQVRVSTSYDSKGTAFKTAISGDKLELRNAYGIINEFLIEQHSDSAIVLLQKGQKDFDTDDCLRFHFLSESKYFRDYKPESEDILTIKGSDTTFIASSKLYPLYKGDKDYFDVMKEGVGDQGSRNLYFMATFVIKKNGEADSLKILESFSNTFDNRIRKNFNKTKKNWQAAILQGKPVNVQMKQEYRYFSSNSMLPVLNFSDKGKEAMKNQDYIAAVYFFDMALKNMPSNVELLYQRAVCKYQLGNKEAACKDLKEVRSLNSGLANELLSKWCE